MHAAFTPYKNAPEEMSGEDALGLVEKLPGPSRMPVEEIIRLSNASSGAVQMACPSFTLRSELRRREVRFKPS